MKDQLASLAPHAVRLQATPVRQLFAADPDRFVNFSRELDGLLLDFSRQRLDAEALSAMTALADVVRLRQAIDGLFAGERVNNTEDRAALHTLLRTPADATLPATLKPLHAEVLAERAKCAAFVAEVQSGQRRGATGKRFADVINIGIGGSDLGPAMAADALRPFHTGQLRCHYVSNVDGTQFADLAPCLDPATTLVIVCSKTFTTQETLANARRLREWLVGALGEAAVPAHFAAVSTNAQAMDTFGIGRNARFAIWDWVGGRYSLWSAVGLSLELAIGTEHFEALLQGANAMDRHFQSAPWRDNLPVLLGLIAIWNRNAMGCASHAVLPYSQRLARFPAYLQQLEMESLGKVVTRDGKPAAHATGPVIWGEPGSNAQHSFFQLLHQGGGGISMDFLLPLTGAADATTDELVIANCLAQVQALTTGNESEDPHKQHSGSRPLSLLVFPQLDPAMLGRLIALYEHQVFVQSVIWGLNPFDQWGVELGKVLCRRLLPAVQSAGPVVGEPAELAGLLAWLRRSR